MSHDLAITDVFGWGAFDSRGNPTVACLVRLSNGGEGAVVVPSGASKGRHEAHELRDGGTRFGGRGVTGAVHNVNVVLRPVVIGRDPRNRVELDRALRDVDGTPNLTVIGANAILSVSLATALAVADGDREPLYRSLLGASPPLLPLPMVNILSGGAHAAGAVDIQDVLAIPIGATSFAQSMEWVWEVRRATQDVLRSSGMGLAASLVADEGGLAAELRSNAEAIETVLAGIDRAGLRAGTDVAIGLDVAATELQASPSGPYLFACEQRQVSTDELVEVVTTWCSDYPIVSVEDPLGEDDWRGWRQISAALHGRVQLVGDDLLVTDDNRLSTAVEQDVANAILIKPNQAGSLEAAHRAVRAAREAGYSTVVSARSGDTEDSWLADLAVGWRAGQIKVGSTTRSERLSKYNRLLRIEVEEGATASFAGAAALAGYSGGADG